MTKQALEGQLFYLVVSFRRLRRPPGQPRPEHAGEPGPAIGRGGLTLHMIEKTTDVPIRPVGVVQSQGLQSLGRYGRASLQSSVAGEDGMLQAADSAALAGAQEVDWQLFRWTGIAALKGSAIGVAQEYALANAEPLTSRVVYPMVDALFVHSQTFVVAGVSADVSPLFPAWFPAGYVHAWGEAQMRIRKD